MYHIRKATTTDSKILSQIGAETFYQTFRPHNSENDMQAYLQKAYNEVTILQNLQNENVVYYLCLDEQMPIGYMKLILNTSYGELKGIELEKIYVLQDYLGSGAGQLLIDKAISCTRENNFQILFLGVWQENKRAVSFYHKNGFETFATRTFQLGERLCEDYMMKLNV